MNAACCDFEDCILAEDHANGFTDLHVRDVDHKSVTIAFSLEGHVKSAAWVPNISEFTFDPDSITDDLNELDELIAGLTEARVAIAEWLTV
ncbi:hypothetical protein DEU37_2880 [Microbacterium sp. AG790]|nr:hypothetical protein DEU37_2880 [Microbacterium sp. AG790]